MSLPILLSAANALDAGLSAAIGGSATDDNSLPFALAASCASAACADSGLEDAVLAAVGVGACIFGAALSVAAGIAAAGVTVSDVTVSGVGADVVSGATSVCSFFFPKPSQAKSLFGFVIRFAARK